MADVVVDVIYPKLDTVVAGLAGQLDLAQERLRLDGAGVQAELHAREFGDWQAVGKLCGLDIYSWLAQRSIVRLASTIYRVGASVDVTIKQIPAMIVTNIWRP